MRLIDADELKEKLSQQWFIDILLTKTNSNDMFSALAEKIDSQPTAYDVDEVVEQLDKVCNDAESNPRKEAYLKALEDYHRLISEECKFMLIKYNPYALHLKEYNDKVLEQLKVGRNIELSEHSESQGNRTGKQKATFEAEPKAE